MPLLRMARIRPATATRSCGLGAGREPGIAGLQLFRRRGDGEAIGVRVDAHRAQRFELLDPREAERVFFVVFVRPWRAFNRLGRGAEGGDVALLVVERAPACRDGRR